MTSRDRLLALLVAAIWGANFVVMDWGLHDVPPLLFCAIRFALVAVPAAFLIPRPEVSWRGLVGFGLALGVVKFGTVYLALHTGMPPGLASLMLQAQVVFTIAGVAAATGERPTRAQAGGIGMAAVGLVVVGLGRGGHVPLVGLVLMLVAAAAWGLANTILRVSGCRSGLGLTVWSAGIAPVPLLGLSLLVDGPHGVAAGLGAFGPAAAVSTLYTVVVSTLIGFGVWNRLLSTYPSAAFAPFALLVPVFGMIASALVVGERPGPGELLGGVLLLAGVAVVSLPFGVRTSTHRCALPRAGVKASAE